MAMKVDETMLDGLPAQCKTPQDVAELYTQMLQRVIDRSLSAELDASYHVGRSCPQATSMPLPTILGIGVPRHRAGWLIAKSTAIGGAFS